MTAQPLPALTSGDPSAWDQALYAFLVEKGNRSGSRRTVESYGRMLWPGALLIEHGLDGAAQLLRKIGEIAYVLALDLFVAHPTSPHPDWGGRRRRRGRRVQEAADLGTWPISSSWRSPRP
jgi:hypothetical protein